MVATASFQTRSPNLLKTSVSRVQHSKFKGMKHSAIPHAARLCWLRGDATYWKQCYKKFKMWVSTERAEYSQASIRSLIFSLSTDLRKFSGKEVLRKSPQFNINLQSYTLRNCLHLTLNVTPMKGRGDKLTLPICTDRTKIVIRVTNHLLKVSNRLQ